MFFIPRMYQSNLNSLYLLRPFHANMTTSISYHLERDTTSIKRQLNLWGQLKSAFWMFLRISRYRRDLELGVPLDGLYLSAKGALKVIDSYTEDIAKNELYKTKVVLSDLKNFNYQLEQNKYFSSPELKEKALKAISALYDVEIELKKKAYTDAKKRPSRRTLLTALGSHSKTSLGKSISALD